MIFTQKQIKKILSIIDYHFNFIIATNFGTETLDQSDLDLLSSFGVKIKDLEKDLSWYDKMYLFGKLSSILRDKDVYSLNFKDFEEYIKRGQYIPLSSFEKTQLEIAKRKTYVHLKGLKERAKNSVNSIILENESKNRKLYEDAVKEGIKTGIADRKTLQGIVSDIGHKLETWEHDWGRIVDTEMNNIYLDGRAEQMKKYEEDPNVYKQPLPGACRHCISFYLTAGIGSKPIVYKLSVLEANGTNVGKPVKDWKPVVYSVHPYCRCPMYNVPKGYIWNEESQEFEPPKKSTDGYVRGRSLVKVQVGDKVFDS